MKADPNWQPRFWAKVEKTDGCWLWRGVIVRGYGQFWLNGKGVRAPRVAWAMAHGPIESRQVFVCHRCDNPLCVRLDHLFLGSVADNAADREAKGRGARRIGEFNPMTTISRADAESIRGLVGTATYRQIADRFGVSVSVVGRIARGESWAVADGPAFDHRHKGASCRTCLSRKPRTCVRCGATFFSKRREKVRCGRRCS